MVLFTNAIKYWYNGSIGECVNASLLIVLFIYGKQVMPQELLMTEQDFMADIPVVISATRLHQPKTDAPTSITVIDREMIKASGAIDVADLMRLVPGFQVGHANGNIFAVTSHGVSYQFPRKLQVLVDGRSVYRPLLSNVDWSILGVSLSNIERIEVIRGPNASVYGTNAFLGTVNIITREPFQDEGFYAETLIGSRATKAGALSYSHALTDFSYRITVNHRQDDGFVDINDERDVNMASVRAIYDVSASDSLDFQFGYNKANFGAWGEANNYLNPVREKQVVSSYGYVRWNRKISSQQEFHIQFYHNYYEQNDLFTSGLLSEELGVDPSFISLVLGGRPDQSISNGRYDGIARRTDLEFQHTYIFSNYTRVVWGTGVREDSMKSEVQLDNDEYVTDKSKRFFVNSELKWQANTVFNFGAMLEDNDIVGTKLSPRLGVNYHVNTNNTLRASVTRAYRTPSLYEDNNDWNIRLNDGALLKALYTTDQELEPERITSYEVGYFTILENINTNIEFKLFREEVKDIIAAPFYNNYPDSDFDLGPLNPRRGVRVWQNGGYSNTNGFEIELNRVVSNQSLIHVAYAYADVEGKIIKQQNPSVYVDLAGYAPKHTFTAMYQRSFSHDLQGSVVYYFVDGMEWDGEGELVPSFSRVDTRLAKQFKISGNKGEIALVIHNLLDRQYNEFDKNNIFERRVYLQLTFRN